MDDIPAAALAEPPLSAVVLDQRALATHLAASPVASLPGRPAPRRPGSDIVRLVRRGSG